MPSRFDPILEIKRWNLADNRPGLSRTPGNAQTIRNLFPNLTGEERVRPGYSDYASTDGGSTPGQDMPAAMQILKVGTIQSPAQDDVHIKFAPGGIYMNPWYRGSTRQATDLLINETLLAVNPTDVDVTISATTSITIANAVANGFSATTGYYNDWVLNKNGTSQYALILTYVVTAGTGVFTTLEDVGSAGWNWATSSVFNLYRNFHANLTFSPTYNADLTNPPTLNTENSIIRWSGGQGSSTGLRGIWDNPHLKRTFFPGTTRPVTFEGTYITERELKSVDPSSNTIGESSTATPLLQGFTYWLGVAPVYDGFQIGQLLKYESQANYNFGGGSGWTGNYKSSTLTSGMSLALKVKFATHNKRITGFAFYLAADNGDTRAIGRQTPYFFVAFSPLTVSGGLGSGWSYFGNATLQEYDGSVSLDQISWNGRGNTYQVDAGIVETPTDIMYSYSIEELIGGRRLLADTYVTSESLADRQNVFTNPVGGNVTIGNVDVIAPDMFSNEESIYRLRIDPTIGTKINAIVATGIDEFLVLKDRGTLLQRMVMIDTIPDLISSIISHAVGAATTNGYAKDDDGWIYFNGYEDIYRYRQGGLQVLIEREDKNDWLDTYRNGVTATEKENTCLFYISDMKAIYFLFGNNRSQVSSHYNDMQYAFFPLYGWRQIRFGEVSPNSKISFKYTAQLQNGHTLGITTEPTASVRRMLWKYDATTSLAYVLWYSDGSGNGTTQAIVPVFDTGEFVISPGRDLRFNKCQILKTLDQPTKGTLDCNIYLDGVKIRTYANQNKTFQFLTLNGVSTDRRLGYTFRVLYNLNTTDPERLDAGNKFQIDAVQLYGDTIPRTRATETGALLGRGADSCLPILGTINGKREVVILLANTPQAYVFDQAFTDTYAGTLGTEPSYRFDIDSAHPIVVGVENTSVNVAVSITARSLTGISLVSPEDNTIVRFSIS